jgi:hypothetical protein
MLFLASIEVVGGRCGVPLVGNTTTTWLQEKLTAGPSVEHLVGIVEAKAASALGTPAPTTWLAEKNEGDEYFTVCCPNTRIDTEVSVVVDLGASATIIFKSTSMWSCLMAIRPSIMLSFTKLSLMALKFASVVVVDITIASARPDGSPPEEQIEWGFF